MDDRYIENSVLRQFLCTLVQDVARDISIVVSLRSEEEIYTADIYDSGTVIVVLYLDETPLDCVLRALTTTERNASPDLTPLEEKALAAAKAQGTGRIVINVDSRKTIVEELRIADIRAF